MTFHNFQLFFLPKQWVTWRVCCSDSPNFVGVKNYGMLLQVSRRFSNERTMILVIWSTLFCCYISHPKTWIKIHKSLLSLGFVKLILAMLKGDMEQSSFGYWVHPATPLCTQIEKAMAKLFTSYGYLNGSCWSKDAYFHLTGTGNTPWNSETGGKYVPKRQRWVIQNSGTGYPIWPFGWPTILDDNHHGVWKEVSFKEPSEIPQTTLTSPVRLICRLKKAVVENNSRKKCSVPKLQEEPWRTV